MKLIKASSRLLTIYNKHLLRYFSEGEVVYTDNFIRCRVPEISMDELSNDYWRYSDKPADYCNMISKLLIGKIQNLITLCRTMFNSKPPTLSPTAPLEYFC